jgi:RND family efflux transporter MFP subunit
MKKSGSIVLLSIILLSGCRNSTETSERPEITRVRTVTVKQEKISIPVHSGGIIATSEELKLSFKAGGIVSEISVKEGARVKSGDLLARLNLSEIRASVNIAEKGHEKALRDWTRAKNLYADTVATLEQFQNATTALEVAQSNLEIARFNLRHSTITAPGDGIILKQLIRENELVGPGYPVFLFGLSGESWKVKAGLSDRDIVRIREGDSASVILDAYPGKAFSAEVNRISSIANPMTGTYEVELLLKNDGYRLAAGFIAGVDIFISGSTRLNLVPVGAIVDADGKAGYVYTVNESGNAIRLQVNIEALTGDHVAVTGLPEGVTEVVSEGVSYLKDGMKVEVVK